MRTMLYQLRELWRRVRSVLMMIYIRIGLYEHIDLPAFNWDKLYKKWEYKDPKIYIDGDFQQNIDFDISVIIPLYNSEKYLRHIIEMFQKQVTGYKFELILVNDGSDDKTKDILLDIANTIPFVHVINQKNGGISRARNTGIEQARGKYLAFMDHDDEVSTEFIQKLMDIVYKENSDLVKCWYGQKYGNEVTKIGSSAGFIWGGVIDRCLFRNVRFPEGYWFEDMINNFIVKPQAKKVIEIQDVLYFKVSSKTNASKKIWAAANYKSLEHIYLIRDLINCYNKLHLNNREYLFNRVLKECSSLAVNRTKELDNETRMQAFQACCELVEKVQDSVFVKALSKKDAIFYKALIDRDYSLWNLAAKL